MVLAQVVRNQQGTEKAISVPVIVLDFAEKAGVRWYYHRNDRTMTMRRIPLASIRRGPFGLIENCTSHSASWRGTVAVVAFRQTGNLPWPDGARTCRTAAYPPAGIRRLSHADSNPYPDCSRLGGMVPPTLDCGYGPGRVDSSALSDPWADIAAAVLAAEKNRAQTLGQELRDRGLDPQAGPDPGRSQRERPPHSRRSPATSFIRHLRPCREIGTPNG